MLTSFVVCVDRQKCIRVLIWNVDPPWRSDGAEQDLQGSTAHAKRKRAQAKDGAGG